MRLLTHDTARRVWTVEVSPSRPGPALRCSQCTLAREALPLGAAARSAALLHLARHARRDTLPTHLRTCQCRERGCCWHRRHRGCHGPVRLALTGERGGRRWRLADVCTACAAATSHTALVPEGTPGSLASMPARQRDPRPGRDRATEHADAQARVRQTLTYLASALPRSCSPGARLVALQCALRADLNGEVRLPLGLLRGMRLHQRADLWDELEYAGWLRRGARSRVQVRAHLLDAAMQGQPRRPQRARSAHWALQPLPRATYRSLPGASRLAAVALASHTRSDGTGAADMELLAHLCGQTPLQLSDLFDRLTSSRLLSSWRRTGLEDEVLWELPHLSRISGHPATGQPRTRTLNAR
ncbi:hypothetical protein RKD45_006855 [Streptomyces griseus]|nr:hypothetical protein [Streptomyces pratensis]